MDLILRNCRIAGQADGNALFDIGVDRSKIAAIQPKLAANGGEPDRPRVLRGCCGHERGVRDGTARGLPRSAPMLFSFRHGGGENAYAREPNVEQDSSGGKPDMRTRVNVFVGLAVRVTLAGCIAGVGSVCWGQTRAGADPATSYPSRPVRIIAQFAPGTTTDLIARVVGQKLTESWGQQVVVDNRPGAGGRIGTEIGANATPDGYTLTMGLSGAHGIAPALYAKLPYDAIRDFAPITNVVTQAQVLVASPAIPARTVKDVVELAKAKPGGLNYASVGPGTATHLTMEMLQSFAKIKLSHVPFKGSPAAHLDLMAGQVHFMFDGLPAALPQIRAGKLRGIAVSTAARQQFALDLPTVAESGYPGFDATGWAGVVAPAKTPAPILDKLNREIVRIINTPETRERLFAMGFNPVGNTREEYARFIQAEIAKWRRVVREAGVKVE